MCNPVSADNQPVGAFSGQIHRVEAKLIDFGSAQRVQVITICFPFREGFVCLSATGRQEPSHHRLVLLRGQK